MIALVINCIVITEFDEDDNGSIGETMDDEEFTVSMAAAKLLQELTILKKDGIFEVVLEFAIQKLQSEKWTD